MKRYLSLMLAVIIVCSICLIPCSVHAAPNAAAEARNGVVRILSVGYGYDEDGNVISTAQNAENKSTMEYSNSNLISGDKGTVLLSLISLLKRMHEEF